MLSWRLTCGAGPGDLGGSRGSISAEISWKNGPKVSGQAAFRHPNYTHLAPPLTVIRPADLLPEPRRHQKNSDRHRAPASRLRFPWGLPRQMGVEEPSFYPPRRASGNGSLRPAAARVAEPLCRKLPENFLGVASAPPDPSRLISCGGLPPPPDPLGLIPRGCSRPPGSPR